MASSRISRDGMGAAALLHDPDLAHDSAITIVPMAILSVRNGLKMRVAQHRRIAKWTFPLWMYVSVTGVLVYFFLYQWYPPA